MGRSIFESMNPYPVYSVPQASGMQQMPGAGQFLNPFQKMQRVMSVMNNPAAFLKERFPDIPDEIMHDPNRILQYLQQTKGITNEDIQRVQGGIPWQR